MPVLNLWCRVKWETFTFILNGLSAIRIYSQWFSLNKTEFAKFCGDFDGLTQLLTTAAVQRLFQSVGWTNIEICPNRRKLCTAFSRAPFNGHVKCEDVCGISSSGTIFHRVQPKRRKNPFLTTKVKPSILATLLPVLTFTVCPDRVKFPLNTGWHCISVHLNKKHNPPIWHTNQALYPEQPPSIYTNSMIVHYPAGMHKEAIYLHVGLFFYFFSPKFMTRLFVAKGPFWMGRGLGGFWENGKSGCRDFFPAIFQLGESCVECGTMLEKWGEGEGS